MKRTPRLIETDGCVFDRKELPNSHGYRGLDAVGQEAFVNHVHFAGMDRQSQAQKLVQVWSKELRANWPHDRFRIYWCEDDSEITLRFHRVRERMPNWYESGSPDVHVIEVADDSHITAEGDSK